MKFSDLPTLVFICKTGINVTLVVPPFPLVDGWKKYFWACISENGVDILPVIYIAIDHPAHAFFASQISLEDYHAPA